MQKIRLCLAFILILSSAQIRAAEDENAAEKGKYAYLSLGDAMILNLSTKRSRLTFLQLKVDVLVNNSAALARIKIHIPAIRHQLILLLSEQDETDMKSPIQREELRKVATTRVQEVMTGLTGSNDITELLFSSFLVQ